MIHMHRLDGPAVTSSNGTKYWYEHNLLHRIDGPAVEYANGNKYWFQKGQCHRIDGPAVEEVNNYKEWYFEGKLIDCKSQEEFERLIKLKAFW